jgi:hypothetical protein
MNRAVAAAATVAKAPIPTPKSGDHGCAAGSHLGHDRGCQHAIFAMNSRANNAINTWTFSLKGFKNGKRQLTQLPFLNVWRTEDASTLAPG